MICAVFNSIRVPLKHNKAIIFLSLLIFLFAHTPSLAAEGGSGAYWPGFRAFLTGVVQSKPGFYLRNDIVVYSATAPRVVLNGLPVENVSLDAVVDLVSPSYVFPKKLFGANHAFLVTQPFIWAKLSGRIIGTAIEPSGRGSGPGDTVVSPFLLGWNKDKLHYNANLAIFIPNGSYDITQVVNTSRNYWTFDPEFGITYLNPRTGWDLSGALGYSLNTENNATHYKSGDVLHFDFATGKMLKNGVKPGVVGYAWMQVTPDSGSGAIFGSFESRVLGLGPGVVWRIPKGPEMWFRYYHEFGAVNHIEGDQFVLTARMAF